jgi:hypothetical protein
MRARVVFFVVLAAAILAACGGGGGGGGGSFCCPATPTPTPIPLPTSEATSAPISATATTPVQFTAISGGTSGSITLPAANAATTASLTFQNAIPSSVAAPSMRGLKGRAIIGGSNLQTLAVITLSVTSTIAVTSTPAFSFTLSSAPSGDAYVAMFDENNPANGWNVLLGPGTISGSTVSFAATTFVPPFTLTAKDTYVFALIASSSAATQAASLSYTGTKSVNYLYNFAFGYPSPSPNTTMPPSVLSYKVSATVSEGSSPAPTPSAGLIDEHVAETDTGSLDTATYATDSWIGISSATAPWSELLYATTQQEPSSADAPVITTNYTNAQTIDQYPATSGASWTNNPAAQVVYNYADGDNGVHMVSSIGTYIDIESILAGAAGGTATLTENSDGSGSIVGPYFGGGIISQVAFAAPSPAASPTSVTVSIDFSTFAQTNYGYPPASTVTDGLWYKLPPAFYTETDTITTNAGLPQSCIPNAFNFTQATDVRRTMATIDTVVGYKDDTIIDSYEYNGVPVCLVTEDIQLYAYDEQANQPYFILVGELGLEVVTTMESLVLTGTPPVSQAASAQMQRASVALQAQELTGFARDRAVRTRTLLTSLRGGRR